MVPTRYSFEKLLSNLEKQWPYVLCLLSLAVISWIYHCRAEWSQKRRTIDRVLPSKILWTSREIPTTFAPGSWQRQSFNAFRARMLLQDPQIFPCIYATKGFKANEHRCCFIEHTDSEPGANISNNTLDVLAAAFDEYAQNWRQYGPMTSLVVLTPLPKGTDSWKPSLSDDRRRFWELLRAISDRDPHEWPTHVPQSVNSPAWTLMFRGERFVGLALTPRYQNRQSRYCDGFVLAFQPIGIFKDLLSTPEKTESALGKVRALTDTLDTVPYSQDVMAVADGKKSVSTMFFISDDDSSWTSLYEKVRSS